MRNILIVVILLTTTLTLAQKKIELVDRDEILEQINQNVENKNFQKVIDLIDKIDESDSVYYSILTTKSYYLLDGLKDYEKAIEVANEGLKKKKDNEYRYYFFNNKALAYMRQDKFEEAIKVLNNGLKEYPKNYLFLYNKGVALDGLKKYKEAADAYKKSIVINPFYPKSHLNLGRLAYSEGKVTKALMCFNVYMLLNPDGNNSSKVLNFLNTAFSTKMTDKKQEGQLAFEDDDDFEEMDLIIDNHAALSKKNKIKNKINIAYVKQNHAFLELLKKYEVENESFWSNKYVPLFQWINNNNHFNSFIYTIAFSSENPTHQKEISKNTKLIKDFVDQFYTNWTNIVSKNNKEMFHGKIQNVTYSYYDYKLEAIGVVEKGKVNAGLWDIYNKQGIKVGEGDFNEQNQKIGDWVWNYESGQLRKKETYVNGKLDKNYKYYYPNGRIKYDVNYKDDQLNGEYLYYDITGALREKKNYTNNSLDGDYNSYYVTGENFQDYFVPYKNGKIDGKVVEYHDNGKIYSEVVYKDGKETGLRKEYYASGNIYLEANYLDGKLNGSYKKYHSNGSVMEEGECTDGWFNGPWKTYFEDGKIQSEFTYSNGYKDGIYKEYDIDQKLYYEFTYNKGDFIAFKYYDKEGNVIHEDKKKKGKFYYKGFHPNGKILGEGHYDIEGGKDGEWKYFSKNGKLTTKSFYKDHKLEGTYFEYYRNGEIASKYEYKKDTLEGYFARYYANNQIRQQGWYKKDNAIGRWETYYPDGSLSEINFYHNGELHGKQEIFTVEGKLDYILFYEYGRIKSGTYYKQDGSLLEELNFDQDSAYTMVYHDEKGNNIKERNYLYGKIHGKYVTKNIHGSTLLEGKFLNNRQEGEWTWFYDNGNVDTKGNFIYDKKDGEWKHYFKNGKIWKETYFDNGVDKGKWTYYNKKGIVTATYNHKYGSYHGETRFFSEEGKLQVIRYYNNGSLIGYSYSEKGSDKIKPMIKIKDESVKMVSYFDNGKVSREMNIVNGWFIGDYKDYYYNGNLRSEKKFVNDRIQGLRKVYYPNGKIKIEENYLFGNLHGKKTEYYQSGKIKKVTNYTNDSKNGLSISYSELGGVTKKETYHNDLLVSEDKNVENK